MILVEFPSSHGPHLWYPALLFWHGPTMIDFFRSPAQHVRADRNHYYFKPLQ
jgi:hypothetical protein